MSFMEESVQNEGALIEASDGFLREQLDGVRTRLVLKQQQLDAARLAGSAQAEALAIEADVLEGRFRDLLKKREDW
jgi:hypothetical protein